jgi:tRNA dimethylallyltransferase
VKPKVLLIVGPTAVGKTALSLSLAKEFGGEIISGDSMQVYKGMDIGTAKASPRERAEVPHHLIDIRMPDEPFSVQEFQQLAREKIAEITARGHLPMIVGGTGLYIEAVIHNYDMPHVPENPALRQELAEYAKTHGNLALHEQLKKIDPPLAEKLHPNDVRRIIRGIEVYQATGVPFSQLQRKGDSPYDALWIGLTMPRDLLYERINRRVDQMIEQGLIDEVKQLKEKGYHLEHTSMQAIGYKAVYWYLEGRISLEEAIYQIKRGTRKYAKRQLSWFRRLSEIHWFDVTQPNVFGEIRQLIAGSFCLNRE